MPLDCMPLFSGGMSFSWLRLESNRETLLEEHRWTQAEDLKAKFITFFHWPVLSEPFLSQLSPTAQKDGQSSRPGFFSTNSELFLQHFMPKIEHVLSFQQSFKNFESVGTFDRSVVGLLTGRRLGSRNTNGDGSFWSTATFFFGMIVRRYHWYPFLIRP